MGDLAGIRAHLDHLVWLGVDALWLSPVYRSPMADFGYDVADHCDVDPLFGDLSDLDGLISDAHSAGLRVILDYVPNHTSDRHPWFEESRRSLQSGKRGWYFWRAGPAGADRPTDSPTNSPPPPSPPNNWRAAFPGVGRATYPPAWTWDEATGQCYLHLFLPEQPDLDWSHPEVRRAMHDVLRFWLARGVDGFRVDVIHALGKDPALPDLPGELAAIPACALLHDPSVHPLVEGLRAVVKSAGEDRVLIGEVVLPGVEDVAAFYGEPGRPGVDLAFNFHPLHAPWEATAWREQIEAARRLILERGFWPAWALSNHDNRRAATRYGSQARARAAAVLLLTLPGTPFVYAGEELGLEDAVVPAGRQVDPGGRDGCRAPIPWVPGPGHGWAGDPWLPWPPGAGEGVTVVEEAARAGSTLDLYRTLIGLRKGSPALAGGDFEWAGGSGPVVAYRRAAAGDERLVAVNFEAAPATMALPPGTWVVQVSTAAASEGRRCAARLDLGEDEAVVLSPASGDRSAPPGPPRPQAGRPRRPAPPPEP